MDVLREGTKLIHLKKKIGLNCTKNNEYRTKLNIKH